MNSSKNNQPIGVFDSGVGGLSVLQFAVEIMPSENFIYLGDFANAPYGNKQKEKIIDISVANAAKLTDMNIKALLIACNTATSAAAHILRRDLSIPVIGLEPAIKPAAQYAENGKAVVVLATPQTLRLNKFNDLLESFDCEIVPVACPGLSRLIETAGPKSKAIDEYLTEILSFVNTDNTSSIVIGCTHFSFISDEIQKITGGIRLFDGRFGAARQLKRVIGDHSAEGSGSITLMSSIDDAHHREMLENFLKYKLPEE
ncbi:MAG: glutamate racemase [Clostridia bacterium]|nr:glutamate racemase [Clostridia bacterium]